MCITANPTLGLWVRSAKGLLEVLLWHQLLAKDRAWGTSSPQGSTAPFGAHTYDLLFLGVEPCEGFSYCSILLFYRYPLSAGTRVLWFAAAIDGRLFKRKCYVKPPYGSPAPGCSPHHRQLQFA